MKYFWVAAFLTLVGCSSSRDLAVEQSINGITQRAQNEFDSNTVSARHIADESRPWWQVFHDPLLNEIVSTVMSDSFDVRRAIADVESAEAVLKGQRAGFFPTLSANSSTEVSTQSTTSANPSIEQELSLTATWNLDVFGQVRKNVKAQEATLVVADDVKRDTQRLVLARAVDLYIALNYTELRHNITTQNLERLRSNLARIQQLVDARYSTRLDLARAQQQVHDVETQLISLQIEADTNLNALALLMAKTPSELKARLPRTSAASFALPQSLPESNASVILTNRPDVRAAEFRLIAASYGEEAARLGLYPTFNLQSSIGSAARDVQTFPTLEGISTSLINSIAMPLLGRGQILSQIKQSEIRTDIAFLEYERTMLTAVNEIAQSIQVWNQLNAQLRTRKASLDSALEAQMLAEKLFYAGETDFTSLVFAEQTRLNAEQGYLQTEQRLFQTYVQYVSAVVPQW